MAGRKRDRAKIKERRKARGKEQQKKMIQRVAVLIGIVVIVAIAIFSIVPEKAPEIALERLELDPVLGNPDAAVTITEYAAFGCSACREWHNSGIIDDILQQFPGQVKFVYRDMPIIDAAWSQSMSEIAQCALDGSNEAFWVAHDSLYEDTELGRTSQSDAVEMVIAADPLIDGEALRECVEANTHHNTVRYDMDRPEAAGIRGTPTWFVNGQQLYSASPQVIIQMIENELGS